MGYFYLFYGDYVTDNNINPYDIISEAKQKIKQKALDKIKIKSNESKKVEQEFEHLYNIQPEDFADDGSLNLDSVLNIGKWKEVNSSMINFDNAIREWGNAVDVLSEAQEAIKAIDEVLRLGASTGGLADGAMETARTWKKKLQALKWAMNNGTAEGDVHKQIKNIASHVSGALLEIAFTYAFLSGVEKGLSDTSAYMMNIGGSSGPRVSKEYRQDPKIVEDINKLRAELSANKGTQSKADSTLNIHPNGVSGTTTWVGFQQKNYQDITNITVATLELGNTIDVYDTDFLVNTAGGLGYNHKQPIPMNPHYMPFYQQGEIDIIWKEVIRTLRLSLAADAIAGFTKNNFTNKVNYYVIRSKKSSKVKIIGVSTILNKIWKDFNKKLDSSLGISTDDDYGTKAGFNFKTKEGYREKYWKENVENFQEGFPSEVKYIRSMRAYQLILNKIRKTKTSISLDFSYYFQA